MSVFNRFASWTIWLLFPFFGGIRWIFFLMLIAFVFYGVRSDFIEILPKENLNLVRGRFLVPPNMGLNRTSQYAIRVLDAGGVVHKCDCSFGGLLNINCLNEDYLLNKKSIEHLKGQSVSLMLAPGPIGGTNLCYELSSAEKTWFKYEEKSEKYITARNGWSSKISWLFLLVIVTSIFVRGIFCKRINNG